MISKEDIEYIKYVYDNRQRYIKPDVRRIIRAYNIVMDDKKHVFHKVSEQICACSLSPYLIQLYRKLESMGYYTQNTPEKEVKPKKPVNKQQRPKKNGKDKK